MDGTEVSTGKQGSRERVIKATIWLTIIITATRLLGYIREVVVYAAYGQSYFTDVYRISFSISDLFVTIFLGGTLSSAFVPVLSAALVEGKEKQGWKAVSVLLNYTLIILAVVIVFFMYRTDWLLNILAPGLPESYHPLAITLIRLILPQMFVVVINGFFSGLLNTYKYFVPVALGTLCYNLAVVLSGLLFIGSCGLDALVYGALAGTAAQFAVQFIFISRAGIRYTFSFDPRQEGFKDMMLIISPLLISLAVAQLNLFVTQNISSGLGQGAISILSLAQKLMNIPVGIFSVAITTTLFPWLAETISRKETQRFKQGLAQAMRFILFITIPITLGFFMLGLPMVRLLFEEGSFTLASALEADRALFYYSIGIVAYSLTYFINYVFYSMRDSLTPVLVSFFTIAANIALSLILPDYMGYYGLAMAYTLAGFLNIGLLLVILRFKIGPLGLSNTATSVAKTLAASMLMLGGLWLGNHYLSLILPGDNKLQLLLLLSLAGSFGCFIFAAAAKILKMEEMELLLDRLRSRFSKKSAEPDNEVS